MPEGRGDVHDNETTVEVFVEWYRFYYCEEPAER